MAEEGLHGGTRREPAAVDAGIHRTLVQAPRETTTVGTEVIGGVTTFLVMAYIIALNPITQNYVGIPDLQGSNLGPAQG